MRQIRNSRIRTCTILAILTCIICSPVVRADNIVTYTATPSDGPGSIYLDTAFGSILMKNLDLSLGATDLHNVTQGTHSGSGELYVVNPGHIGSWEQGEVFVSLNSVYVDHFELLGTQNEVIASGSNVISWTGESSNSCPALLRVNYTIYFNTGDGNGGGGVATYSDSLEVVFPGCQ